MQSNATLAVQDVPDRLRAEPTCGYDERLMKSSANWHDVNILVSGLHTSVHASLLHLALVLSMSSKTLHDISSARCLSPMHRTHSY